MFFNICVPKPLFFQGLWQPAMKNVEKPIVFATFPGSWLEKSVFALTLRHAAAENIEKPMVFAIFQGSRLGDLTILKDFIKD